MLALVLDFGAVISKTIFEFPYAVASAFGLPSDAFPWRGPFDPTTDPLWRSMQADEISEREYWARRAAQIGQSVGRELDTRAFVDAAYRAAGDDAFRPEVERLMRSARRAGVKVGVLTNELELFHGKAWVESLAVLRWTDAIVDATQSQILKPDPRAYVAIAKALAVPPARTLFVDDQQRNVAGAIDVGMHAIHFRVDDVTQSIAMIRAALGLEPDTATSEVAHVYS